MNVRREGSRRHPPGACGSLAVFLRGGLILRRIRSSTGLRRGRPCIDRALTDGERSRKAVCSSLPHSAPPQNVNKCMEMTPPPGSILEIILDLFSFNEVDIFLRKTGGKSAQLMLH